ncbi:MAG: Xaa-Pro peptidase family protein [Fimbriiglobus sp.]|jgi:Xaa-Pro aminopeptidase|nr:Xaa-Pro peptidase family protein [Fimbriiglobus sp.]
MDFHQNRRAQLLRGSKTDDVDAYLVTHPANVRYLSGFDTADAVVVSNKGAFVVFPAEAIPAKKLLPQDVTPIPRADDDTLPAIAEAVKATGGRAVAIEGDHLTVTALQTLVAAVGKTPLKPLTGRVELLRQTKDPSEVDAIRRAVAIGGRAMLMFRAILREVDTELELCRQMDQLLLRAGAHTPAFPSVVALGESASAVVLRPTHDRPVSEVSKLFIHWGAEVGGYCGTLARTLRSPFGAPPLRKTKNERTAVAYDKVSVAVRQAIQAALAAIQPESTVADVAKAAHTQLAAAGFDKYAAAEVGHGVGLTPREGPIVRPDNSTPLFPGMVITICPQVRIPDWGMVKYSQVVVVNREGFTDLGGGPAADE